jgi:hypothetical protein
VSGAGGASISTTKFDADVGVMATGSLGQLGLSIRNLLQPSFAAPGGGIRLARRVRAGVSIHAGQATTVAADLDLTAAATARGEWRDAAIGVESHPVTNGWVRGGVHWNTRRRGAAASASAEASADRSAGQAKTVAAPVASLGASYAIYGAAMADAQVSFGSAEGDRGWGIGLRFVF